MADRLTEKKIEVELKADIDNDTVITFGKLDEDGPDAAEQCSSAVVFTYMLVDDETAPNSKTIIYPAPPNDALKGKMAMRAVEGIMHTILEAGWVDDKTAAVAQKVIKTIEDHGDPTYMDESVEN